MLNLNRNHYIAIATLISVVVYFSLGSTPQEKIEKARQEIVQNAKADNETLGSSYDTFVKKLLETKGAININEKCINANAQTGTVVDCETITPDEFDVILKPVTNSWTVTATIKAEPSVNNRDKILMDRICAVNIHDRKSPLCNDWNLYNKWKEIFEKKWVSWSIALGIMYSESHIGANYAGTCDTSYNNWGWIKWRITDDGKAIKNQPIPQNGCWLYKFNSVEDYFNSKANTLVKYKSCFSKDKPIECISYAYVGNRYVAERSWIARVAQIAY